MPRIAETLTDYDEESRSLTYQAGGLPRFITTARSTWSVVPASGRSCRVTVTAQFQARGVLGLLGCRGDPILAQAWLAARHLQADLRQYVKHGTPPPASSASSSGAGHADQRALACAVLGPATAVA